MATQSFYSFKMISYNTLEFIVEKLNERSANYYIVEHDKDLNENGETKEKHFHIVFTVPVRMRFKQVFNLFNAGEEQNTLVQVSDDLTHDIRYLTHKDNPEKHQYDDSEIISNNVERYNKYVGGRCDTDEEKNEIFIDDLCSFSVREMCIKYGRDYMRYYKQYNEVKEMLLSEVRELKSDKVL